MNRNTWLKLAHFEEMEIRPDVLYVVDVESRNRCDGTCDYPDDLIVTADYDEARNVYERFNLEKTFDCWCHADKRNYFLTKNLEVYVYNDEHGYKKAFYHDKELSESFGESVEA